jgi:hypothetical protein
MNFKQGDLVFIDCEQRTYDSQLKLTEIKRGTPGTIIREWTYYESRARGEQQWAEVWLGGDLITHVACRNLTPLEKV